MHELKKKKKIPGYYGNIFFYFANSMVYRFEMLEIQKTGEMIIEEKNENDILVTMASTKW